MQIIRFTFALSSLVALLAHAAPISVSIFESLTSYFINNGDQVIDGSDSFEARDGDVDLSRRARLIPVGPGVRHPEDGELYNLLVPAYIEFPLTSLYARSWRCTFPSYAAWSLCSDT